MTVEIYVGGSCIETGLDCLLWKVGYGVWFGKHDPRNLSVLLEGFDPDRLSIPSGNVYSDLKGIEAAIMAGMQYEDTKVIYTPSTPALKAIKNDAVKARLVKRIRHLLKESGNTGVEYCYRFDNYLVRAHILAYRATHPALVKVAAL